MTRLPDRLPGGVESRSANHLHVVGGSVTSRDDSSAVNASGAEAQPVRLGQVAVERLRTVISERELDIVRSVDEFRLLSAGQIERLHFAGHASDGTAGRIRRRVLERLIAGRLLQRLDRRIGGIRAGSTGFIYQLAPLGYRLVYGEAKHSGLGAEPGRVFIDHTLAIADLAIAVQHSGAEVLERQTEPACWRPFLRGLSGRAVLKPDLFVALGVGQFEYRWFVETDRATSSLTAVTRKCRTYLDYYRSGIEQRAHEIFPRVLWVVPDRRRLDNVRAAIQRDTALHDSGLFTVAISDEAVPVLSGGSS